MLSEADAYRIVKAALPNGTVNATVRYRTFYLFQVFQPDPDEGQWDPFFSVDVRTGEFRDYSIFADENTQAILSLFEQAVARR